MRRRALLACALSAAIAGCTDDDPNDGNNETDGGEDDPGGGNDRPDDGDNESDTANGETDDGENGVEESKYRVVVEAPESDPDDGSVCEFEALPAAARDEFEAAIEGVDFESADRGDYTSTSSPAILDTDCYNSYVAYEGEYYWVGVDVGGG
ncbi:hypothetical protein [Halorubrum sp. CSM-61]|uniref:hypothetical protein n=1 Tax=Halorubrum sp. CSM-61 TaxID=2485838 RepID=UPI000F4CE8BE|nr:hypothetical protein [Halorubrum sp. CSM-61]